MSRTPSPEVLRTAEDAAAILSGLARALTDRQASPTGSKYAEQVAAAAEAVSLMVVSHRATTPDPVWAGIAADEHRSEITFHLTRKRD